MTHFSLAIIFTIFWGLGIPGFAWRQLRNADLSKEEAKEELGFLFNGYTYKNYLWECVITVRKVVLIISSTVFSTRGKLYQTICLLLILSVFLALQFQREPFHETMFNKIEASSLICALILVYGGYYLTSRAEAGDETDSRNDFSLGFEFEITLFIVFLLFVGYFFYLWFYKLYIETDGFWLKKNRGELTLLSSSFFF